MRNTNHLEVSDFLSGVRESHIARIITRALIIYPVAVDIYGMVREAALTVIEIGASFLVTGNTRMGVVAMDRLALLQRIAPALAKIADCLATLFASAYRIDRRQGEVSFKRLKAGRIEAGALAYAKAVCAMICPSKPALRVVRWAA